MGNNRLPQAPLGELFDFASGLSKAASEFGFGAPFLSFKDVFNNFYLDHELGQLVNSTASEREKHSVREGDVFLTRTSETQQELGMSSVALRDYPQATFNGFTKRLRPKPGVKLYPRYLAYAFRSPHFRQAVTSMSSLATRASLNNEMMARLTIPCPDWEVQCRIGDVLHALDAKAKVNRQMNQTLEAMARALFKSWFVDFEPVVAKSEGRPTGLPPDLDALFPSAFEDSACGEIPNGWRVATIADLCQQVVNGSTPSRSEPEYWHFGTIPWFRTGELDDGFLLQAKERTSEAGHRGSSTKLLPRFSVVMAIYAAPTVGRLGVLSSPGTFNQAMTGMVPRTDVGPWFLFEQLYHLRSWFNERANGAAQQNISKLIVESAPVVRPGADLLAEFNRMCEPWYLARERSSIECLALTALRDDLLPRLLGGEVEVAEAEEMALG